MSSLLCSRLAALNKQRMCIPIIPDLSLHNTYTISASYHIDILELGSSLRSELLNLERLDCCPHSILICSVPSHTHTRTHDGQSDQAECSETASHDRGCSTKSSMFKCMLRGRLSLLLAENQFDQRPEHVFKAREAYPCSLVFCKGNLWRCTP